jgi:hypothetical protein
MATSTNALVLAALMAAVGSSAVQAEQSFVGARAQRASVAANADFFHANSRSLACLANKQDLALPSMLGDAEVVHAMRFLSSTGSSNNSKSRVVDSHLELALTAAKKVHRDGRLRYNPRRLEDARAMALGARAKALMARREALDAMRSKMH